MMRNLGLEKELTNILEIGYETIISMQNNKKLHLVANNNFKSEYYNVESIIQVTFETLINFC